MSDRKNTDDKNTSTVYIDPAARADYNRRMEQKRMQRNAQQSAPRPVQQNTAQPRPTQPQAYNNGYNQPQQPYNSGYGQPQQPYNNGYNQPQQPYNNGYSQPQQPYNNGYNQPQQPYNNGYNQPQQPYNNGYGAPPQMPYNNGQYGQPYPPPRPSQIPPQKSPQGQRRKPSSNPPSRKKRKRKKSLAGKIIRRIIAVLLILFLLIFGMYSCTAISLIRKMDHVSTGERMRTSDALARSYVRSVLLIGTDGRTTSERGRSDTMILISLNSRTDEISLTSFMRDCYVSIPDRGWDKLNAAYSYGGPELLMDTIESNFGVQIDDYVSVNFVSFANIVDSVGGIDLDVSEAEMREINTILQAEVNEIMGDNTFDDLLDKAGKIHLNGKQALSYARIRYVGNSDFERTERQREVMELMLKKLRTFKPTVLSNISRSVLPGVTTNMTFPDLYLLSLRAPTLLGYDMAKIQIPAEGTYYGAATDSGDALIVDLEANYNYIKDTVFANEK